jgi:hypothetical protein
LGASTGVALLVAGVLASAVFDFAVENDPGDND